MRLNTELKEFTEADISLNNERRVMASEVEKVKKIRQILKRMRPELFGQSGIRQEEPVKSVLVKQERAEPAKKAEAKKLEERPSLRAKMQEKKELVDNREKEKKERGDVRPRNNGGVFILPLL